MLALKYAVDIENMLNYQGRLPYTAYVEVFGNKSRIKL